jgi:hypothetical protein
MSDVTLGRLSRELGDLLHLPPVWERVRRDTDAVAQITAARDVLEDTDRAIAAHQAMSPREDLGELYLVVYGVLQALDAQAEATQALVRAFARATSLDFKFTTSMSKELARLLLVKHRAVAHSVKGEKDKECVYFGITENSLRHNQFNLHSWESMVGRKRESPEVVEIPALLRNVQTILRGELIRLRDAIAEGVHSTGASEAASK